jgi:Protein of unknown function DUF2625
MTGTAIDQLLGRARGPLGAQIELDFGVPDGPLAELADMLTRMNGFFLFNAGVQVFRAGEPGVGPELQSWNQAATWKESYGGLAEGLFCFGQDLFGTQFAVRDGAQVVVFDPETADVEALGASLQDWASWLLEDPDVRGAAGFARSFQDAEGPLQPDQRLVPLQPFVGGGDYDFGNLSVKDAVAAMRIRGPIAQQLRDLPEGSAIRLRP